MSDIVFGGIGHCVLLGKIDETGASKILFDNFNIYNLCTICLSFAAIS